MAPCGQAVGQIVRDAFDAATLLSDDRQTVTQHAD
jgi:hypothetical protein